MQKVSIPKYSLGEEITNAISHGLGVIFGLVALVWTLIVAARGENTVSLVSALIYSFSMIIMYLMSCLYHSLSPKLKAKKVFRVIDHCDIYIFIAGSYTPFCLSLIGGKEGMIIFVIVWISALIGVVLNAIDLEKYKIPSTIMYLLMGWMIIFSFNSLKAVLPLKGIIYLLLGGITYSIGAILYILGAKHKYCHTVFHFFVLLGSILQFISIIKFAI